MGQPKADVKSAFINPGGWENPSRGGLISPAPPSLHPQSVRAPQSTAQIDPVVSSPQHCSPKPHRLGLQLGSGTQTPLSRIPPPQLSLCPHHHLLTAQHWPPPVSAAPSPQRPPSGCRGVPGAGYSPPGAARGACSSASCAQQPLHRHAWGALGGLRPGANCWPPLPAALWLGAELAFAEGANGNCSHMEAASAARHFAYLISALTPRVMHSQAARQQGGTTGWAGRGAQAGPRGSARPQRRARALWGWLGLAAENSRRLGGAAAGAPHIAALQPPDSPRFRHEARDALPRGELFPLAPLGHQRPASRSTQVRFVDVEQTPGTFPDFHKASAQGASPAHPKAGSSQAPTPMQKPT